MSGDVIYLAHVRNQSHFVLLTGVDDTQPETFLANDPNYNVTGYALSQIHDIIMYSVHPAEQGTNIPLTYPLYKQCDPVSVSVSVCLSVFLIEG